MSIWRLRLERRPTLWVACLMGSFLLACPARADFIMTIDPTVVALPNGLWQYDYAVTVDTSSDAGASMDNLYLSMPAPFEIVDVHGPSNYYETFTAADDGTFGGPQMVSALSWSLIDPDQSGLQPGSSGVFEIIAAAPPGQIVFAASDNTTDSNSLGFLDGTTTGPVNPVPEPTSFVIGGSGLVVLSVLAASRSRGGRR